MTTLRDALQIQRLNTMRRRRAEALARAARNADTCDCVICQLKRGMPDVLSRLAEAQAEDSPADVAAIAPSRAH
jgi:hypothetical protein